MGRWRKDHKGVLPREKEGKSDAAPACILVPFSFLYYLRTGMSPTQQQPNTSQQAPPPKMKNRELFQAPPHPFTPRDLALPNHHTRTAQIPTFLSCRPGPPLLTLVISSVAHTPLILFIWVSSYFRMQAGEKAVAFSWWLHGRIPPTFLQFPKEKTKSGPEMFPAARAWAVFPACSRLLFRKCAGF